MDSELNRTELPVAGSSDTVPLRALPNPILPARPNGQVIRAGVSERAPAERRWR